MVVAGEGVGGKLLSAGADISRNTTNKYHIQKRKWERVPLSVDKLSLFSAAAAAYSVNGCDVTEGSGDVTPVLRRAGRGGA